MNSQSILIVDDERHIRTLLQTMLKRQGYENIVQASNGNQALTLFREHKPDLVLLDLNMPLMDGITCLSQLKKTGIPAKVLILTAQANARAVEECREGGADGFMRKDSSSAEILRIVQEALPLEHSMIA